MMAPELAEEPDSVRFLWESFDSRQIQDRYSIGGAVVPFRTALLTASHRTS
jgi:hypothetical protein